MTNQAMVKLKVNIQLGHCQSHQDNTCTKITALVLANIKLITTIKVLLQSLQAINLEVTKEMLCQKMTLQDLELTNKIL